MSASYDYTHCLRPTFTKQIFEQLLDDRSLNPYGERDRGRTRLVKDLLLLTNQAQIETLTFNMTGFQDNYDGFIKEVKLRTTVTQPTGLRSHTMPQSYNNQPQSTFAQLIQQYQIFQIKEQLILFLEDFHVMLDNPDHNFPLEFFKDLNALKNSPKITLCCITTQPHKASDIYYNTGNSSTSSFLELTPEQIQRAERSEIKAELNRRLQKTSQWQNEQNQERIISEIGKYELPLSFLALIEKDYKYKSVCSFDKRILRCKDIHKVDLKNSQRKKMPLWDKIKLEVADFLGLVSKAKNMTDE